MEKFDLKKALERMQKMSAAEAETYIEGLEEQELQEGGVWLTPNHELEIYLFAYYVTKDEYRISEIPFHLLYGQLAKKWLAEGIRKEQDADIDYGQKAMQAYRGAMHYNPVDVELLTEVAALYRTQKNWEGMLGTVQSMYPYIFTRKDMSVYYRYLGNYYLETYQPELAEKVYAYSNLYYKNQQADADIHYLEKALDRPMQKLEPQRLQEELQKAGIPGQPKAETLGILYHTAKSSLERGDREYAKQLFICLYQLTQDQEVGEILRELS